jgi:hypothetical protein
MVTEEFMTQYCRLLTDLIVLLQSAGRYYVYWMNIYTNIPRKYFGQFFPLLRSNSKIRKNGHLAGLSYQVPVISVQLLQRVILLLIIEY